MNENPFWTLAIPAGAALLFGACAHPAGAQESAEIARIVDEAIRPVMKEHDIPGMAVAVTIRGQRHFFNYGVASKQSGQRVTEDTIFEIGSISKTFTATLGSYAQVRGVLSLSDSASYHMPTLSGSAFDQISLLDLATYTAGGLPLQFPADVTDQNEMIAYFQAWRPEHPAGTHRRYSNPSIGLFGHLVARRMEKPFEDLMEDDLFPALGLMHTYIDVPQGEVERYAYGYTKENKAIRVNPGVLDAETYGVKTTSADLIRFVEANIDSSGLNEALQRAIAETHVGYHEVGPMTQALGWEIYDWPTDLDALLAGNSAKMAFEANAATGLDPQSDRDAVLINKTGSTNGFGAYVVFVPSEEVGIVMLANRNYFIPDRVKAAHAILSALADETAATSAR